LVIDQGLFQEYQQEETKTATKEELEQALKTMDGFCCKDFFNFCFN
jgi:hypothetical protein